MIIARSKTKKAQIIMLGLSRENINRMLDGKPVHVREETHGEGIPAGWEIVIFFGETEKEMHEMFIKGGMIGPETKMKIDPRLKS